MPRLAVHGMLVGVTLMWGLVFVAVHEVLRDLDSLQLVTIRFFLISVVFVAIFVAVPGTRPKLSRSQLGLLAVAGILAVPGAQLPVVEGQRYLSPPLVSTLVAMSPAMAAVFAWRLLRERFTARQIVGFVVALSGAAVVVIVGSGEGTELTIDNPWGAALTIVSPAAWALYTVISKPLAASQPPITAVGVAVIVGTLTLIPLMPHSVGAVGDITGAHWGWMIYLIFGGTVVPYVLWNLALKTLPASQVASYMFGVPFAALLWSWLILDVVPSGAGLLGGAVIIVGVVLTQVRTAPTAGDDVSGDVGETAARSPAQPG